MKRIAVSVLIALLFLIHATAAMATWSAAGTGPSNAKARTMPSGSTPTAIVSNRNLSVTWPQATFSDGTPVGYYVVKRYDASSGLLQSIGASCSGMVSGLGCTESAVPSGSWKYTVTPKLGVWSGAESSPSASALVPAASLTFNSSTTVTNLPATLDGSIASYVSGETVSFRLDDPSTGNVLAGTVTPSSIPTSGAATVAVTIPCGATGGAHTVYAVGSLGTIAHAGITVSADCAAPTVTASVIAKPSGGIAGYIPKNANYFVYANAADTGTPASGVASVTANVDSITAAASNTALTSNGGPWIVDGLTYAYRSAALTSRSTLADGTQSYTVSATDAAGNVGVDASFSVTIDSTPPSATNVQTANGGTAARPDQGDTITFTFSEQIEPRSLLSTWSGASTNVVVRINDGGIGNDTLTVFNSTNASQIPLGSVDLGRFDYVIADVTFGATGTSSTMVQSGTSITVTLGAVSAVPATPAVGNGSMTWTPSSSATDRAGNACSTTGASELGGADADF